MIKYRPDVDGLRAIAVLSVIIYHAKITLNDSFILPGGYLGVDIFFVISGYLITSILVREMNSKSFTFSSFYLRRIRRILPALFTVFIFTLILGWSFLLPLTFYDLAESMISSLFFYSNLYFHFEGLNYSAQNSLNIPLLHTWSLSVEEQFYILFPIFLLFVFRYLKKYLVQILFLGFFCSLLIADINSRINPSFNFYILPTRGFELLMGSLLAYFETYKPMRGSINKYAEQISTSSFILLCLCFVFFTEQVRHPSLITLIPVISVSLIIWYSNNTSRLFLFLSNKFILGIGLISYSLYLWHYPIFAFARINNFMDGNIFILMILLSIIFLLSIITYLFIEKPFRDRNKITNKAVIFSLLPVLIIITISCLVIMNQGGFVNRMPEILKTIGKDPLFITRQNLKPCYDRRDNFCIFNEGENRKKVFIVGDSQLSAFQEVLRNELENSEYELITMLNPGCYYLPYFNQVDRISKNVKERCDITVQQNRKKMLDANPGSIIIFGGRLPLYLEEVWFDNREGGIEPSKLPDGLLDWYFEPENLKTTSLDERNTLIRNSIRNSLIDLLDADHRVIIIYPVPPVGVDVSKETYRIYLSGLFKFNNSILDVIDISTSYDIIKERFNSSYEILDNINHKNLKRVYPETILCNSYIQNRCATNDGKTLFYYDDDHLSIPGAELILNSIINEIEK